MKTVRDACQLQPNALAIKLSDQVEQLDELIAANVIAPFNENEQQLRPDEAGAARVLRELVENQRLG